MRGKNELTLFVQLLGSTEFFNLLNERARAKYTSTRIINKNLNYR